MTGQVLAYASENTRWRMSSVVFEVNIKKKSYEIVTEILTKTELKCV